MFLASKWTVHSLSHNCPTDNNVSLWMSGRIWTCLALLGSVGMSSSASWVDNMMSPLGLRTAMGCCVGRLLIVGAWWLAKLCVLPVSAMACCMLGADGMSFVGGPSVEQNSVVNFLLGNNLSIELCRLLGFHLSQFPICNRRPVIMRLLPPFMLLAVAS